MAFEKDEILYNIFSGTILLSISYHNQQLINYAVRNRLQQLMSEQVFELVQNTRIGLNCDPYLAVFE